MSYIRFENLSKSFGKHEVLTNIDLDVEKGQLVTLLGPSGCGKSTLLRCLAGLETVTAGNVYLDGKNITNVSPKDRDIGMVFQQYSLFPNMDVAQNVAFGLKQKKVPKEEITKRVEEMVDIVGLTDHLHHYPAEMSGGQQQRAALARAMVTNPKVLLLDEPLSAIDALLRHSLQVEIRRIQKEMDITAIFVTHDQDEAMVMSDVIHLMYKGKIEQSAPPTEMYTQPVSKFAATFIGHYNVMPMEIFRDLTGKQEDATDVAFRPEVVELGTEPIEQEGYLSMKGTVSVSLPHGNVLRYAVICGGHQVDVDVLFKKATMIENNTDVYLSFKEDDCIFL
ncbi:MAG: ABC transporter ATP-binding protein [Clostridia bacterium]|nr:ABC transporter ATP-binding protein [Lachnospiraceae bacterium]NCC00387.1 ABC transporter ATP-binding protein [Clostridia bacterium]NCD02586.1 ABC transporter ATP-binding protein [Clostridia bacterium]